MDIGEDQFNVALHDFLTQHRCANANNQVDSHDNTRASGATDQPYPDTRRLVDAIRAHSQKMPDGKYKVTLQVQARQLEADGNGAETRVPLAGVDPWNNLIDRIADDNTIDVTRQ